VVALARFAAVSASMSAVGEPIQAASDADLPAPAVAGAAPEATSLGGAAHEAVAESPHPPAAPATTGAVALQLPRDLDLGHPPLPVAPPPARSWRDTLCGPLAKAVSVSAASSVLSGYDQGVIASAMLTMKEDIGLTDVEEELSIGVLNMTAALGGLCAGLVAEWLGRKKAIALANAFFLVGSVCIALCQGFGLLFLGRMLQGAGVGFALVVAPIFTAELVPPEVRGGLVSLGDVCTNGGILVGYSAGLMFLGVAGGWRSMFGLGCVPAMIILCLIWSVPESPRWLVSRGRFDEARKVLLRLAHDPNPARVDAELADMKRAAEEASGGGDGQNGGASGNGGWGDVAWHPDPVVRTMVWRGLGVAFFSQAMGTEAVVYFAGSIVQTAGVESVRDTLLAIMGVGLCKLIFLLIGSSLFDRVGRRPMLLTSSGGLTVSLILLAMATVGAGTSPALAITGLCMFMASFSLGFSPLVYVICSELFPSSVRARAMSCALFITRVVAGVISSSFLSLRIALSPAGAWLAFVPIAALSFVFVLLLIPETKGLSLEEVSGMFAARMAGPRRAPCWRGCAGKRYQQHLGEGSGGAGPAPMSPAPMSPAPCHGTGAAAAVQMQPVAVASPPPPPPPHPPPQAPLPAEQGTATKPASTSGATREAQ